MKTVLSEDLRGRLDDVELGIGWTEARMQARSSYQSCTMVLPQAIAPLAGPCSYFLSGKRPGDLFYHSNLVGPGQAWI